MNRIARYFDPQADDDVVSYSYDAHGNRVPSDGTAAGLQWNMTHHFDPTVGRWMSEDPIGHAGDDDDVRRYVSE